MNKKNLAANDENTMVEQRSQVEQELRTRSQKDEIFRKQLQSNPQEALEEHYPQWFPGGKMPAGLNITIIEENAHSFHLVLPSAESDSLTLAEVSEQELEHATGGAGIGALKGAIGRLKGGKVQAETTDCNSAYACQPTILCYTTHCSAITDAC